MELEVLSAHDLLSPDLWGRDPCVLLELLPEELEAPQLDDLAPALAP